MIAHNCEQGTDQWRLLRAGIPTASCFEKIVTPTGKLSTQSRDYKAWLLAERILRRPLETRQTPAMIRGTQFEAEAVNFYEGVRDKKTELIGFVTTDDLVIGASPDRWAGDDGQLEIKVPEPQTQMAYFMAELELSKAQEEVLKCEKEIDINTGRNADALKDLQKRYAEANKELKSAIARTLFGEYKIQVYGQLWVTERKWSDIMTYSPEGFPEVFVHVKRDEEFIGILARSVREFSRDLEQEAAELKRRGIIPEE